jgi:thioredoxin reductase (NADPH)
MSELYDSIIIGAGPAGLGAAIYTARDRLKTLVLEKFFPGGQIINTDRVENYPGFDQITGPDLILKMQNQAEKFGAEISPGNEVTSLKKLSDGNIEIGCDDKKYIDRAAIENLASPAKKNFATQVQALVIAEHVTRRFSKAGKS